MAPNLEYSLSLIALHPDMFRPDFAAYLKKQFHVFAEFHRRALLIAARRKHYSSRSLAESIRHDTAIGELDETRFKLNGNYVPDMGRLFMLTYPQYEGFFEFRERKAAA